MLKLRVHTSEIQFMKLSLHPPPPLSFPYIKEVWSVRPTFSPFSLLELNFRCKAVPLSPPPKREKNESIFERENGSFSLTPEVFFGENERRKSVYFPIFPLFLFFSFWGGKGNHNWGAQSSVFFFLFFF